MPAEYMRGVRAQCQPGTARRPLCPILQSMDRTRLTGLLLMAAAVIELLLFCGGVARRRYAALALPVTVGVALASALAFWMGWTLISMEDDLAGLEFETEPLDD